MPAATRAATNCLLKSSDVTRPLCLRTGSNHSRRFGCIVTNRFCAVFDFSAVTFINLSSKSISLQSRRSISARRRPAKSPIAMYGSMSGVALSSNRAACVTVSLSEVVEKYRSILPFPAV